MFKAISANIWWLAEEYIYVNRSVTKAVVHMMLVTKYCQKGHVTRIQMHK